MSSDPSTYQGDSVRYLVGYLLYHWVLDVSASRVQVSDGHGLYGRLMCRDKSSSDTSVLRVWPNRTVQPGSENWGVTT